MGDNVGTCIPTIVAEQRRNFYKWAGSPESGRRTAA